MDLADKWKRLKEGYGHLTYPQYVEAELEILDLIIQLTLRASR